MRVASSARVGSAFSALTLSLTLALPIAVNVAVGSKPSFRGVMLVVGPVMTPSPNHRLKDCLAFSPQPSACTGADFHWLGETALADASVQGGGINAAKESAD